ncbi:sulfite exporter TauE/SafE family protein [Desulfovibrio sp. JC010]|uniref:sulfite exporter TauE/SafE family protein n=1 Tax=Desulfovibrio sp. JC010 TaxID=2593641 RepID=UPI0013D49FC8|nr:sulfite exporter TauE/SafE family protein [Desulfovibrio sp. JC010]NDV25424.1 sulfite exporter TauE/SafE family protein [Desulfovibrio sp. JC010]
MSPFLLVPLIFLSAGFIQGLTGFGQALLAMPLLAFIMDIKLAVPLCTLCGMIVNINMTHRLRKNLERAKILPLIIGSIPGSIFGTMMLKEVNGDYIRLFLGILITSFSAYSLLAKPIKLNLSSKWGYFSGFLTGSIAAAVSAGGPPSIIYASIQGWSKDAIKATLVSFFLFSGTLAACGHLLSGLTTFYVFQLALASILPIYAGTYLGSKLSSRISDEFYRRIVMTLLVFMGLMLVFQNV